MNMITLTMLSPPGSVKYHGSRLANLANVSIKSDQASPVSIGNHSVTPVSAHVTYTQYTITVIYGGTFQLMTTYSRI